MRLHRFIELSLLVSCLVLVTTACSPMSSVQPGPTKGSPTVSVQSQPITGNFALQTSIAQPDFQALLRRPLHLPHLAVGATCPTSPEKRVSSDFGIAQGNGPAYATIGTEAITSPAIFHYADAQHFDNGNANNQGWGGQKVLWFVNPSYQGMLLVRGQQIDGSHEMRFSGGFGDQPLSQQLALDTTLGGSPWPNTASYTRLQAPGCYAYQVDGANFSDVIIFQAVASVS